MRLRLKIILILIIAFSIYCIIDFFMLWYIIYPRFIELENKETTRNLERVTRAIDSEIVHYAKFCQDWAIWDDTYNFIVDKNHYYIDSNLIHETFINTNLNLIFYYKLDGSYIWGQAYDADNKKSIILKKLPQANISPQHELLSFNWDKKKLTEIQISGLYVLDNKPFIIVSRPVLTSNGEGPVKGIIIMGRFITPDYIKTISEQANVKFNFSLLGLNSDISANFDNLTNNDDIIINKNFKEQLLVYKKVPDINGVYKFLIKMVVSREITIRGKTTINFAVLSIVIAGMLTLFVIIILISILVLIPVKNLTRHAEEIGEGVNYSIRLPLKRKDEIGIMSKEINNMLDKIENQQALLEIANEELHKVATTDKLTQIANRFHFDEIIAYEWKRLQRTSQYLAILLVDVDYFKLFNDHYGHSAGDKCLRIIAQTIEKSVRRPGDLAARYGGEEFIVMLPDTNTKGALMVAENIKQAIDDLKYEHVKSQISKYVTISIGIKAVIPTKSIRLEDTIDIADKALYSAKRQGRNRICYL